MKKKPITSLPATVTEFLDMQYGDTIGAAEKAQCHQTLVEFVSILLEINQQQRIVHADGE